LPAEGLLDGEQPAALGLYAFALGGRGGPVQGGQRSEAAAGQEAGRGARGSEEELEKFGNGEKSVANVRKLEIGNWKKFGN
jgi:hypothetical protein